MTAVNVTPNQALEIQKQPERHLISDELDGYANSLYQEFEALESLAAAMEAVATKFSGSVPCDPSKVEGARAEPNGLNSRFHLVIQDIRTQRIRLEEAIGKF